MPSIDKMGLRFTWLATDTAPCAAPSISRRLLARRRRIGQRGSPRQSDGEVDLLLLDAAVGPFGQGLRDQLRRLLARGDGFDNPGSQEGQPPTLSEMLAHQPGSGHGNAVAKRAAPG